MGTVTRANLANNKSRKRSAVVVETDDSDDAAEFTQRVLLSLVVDISCLAENVERVKVQVMAMARANGISSPVD